MYIAVDTLGNLLTVKVTVANELERAQAADLAAKVQEITGETVVIAYVNQGYTGESASQKAAEHKIKPKVVKHTEAKKGFILLPRRWVVERTYGCMARFRRLTRDYERLSEVLAGWHRLALLTLILKQVGFQCQ